MKVIEFDARKKIINEPFRHNDHIEEIYLEIADMVLARLYKAFPFNSFFEGFSWDNKPNEFYQSVLIMWADCFMEWSFNDRPLAEKAVTYLIQKNITPSLGIFRAAYLGEDDQILMAQYEKYIGYIYSKSTYLNGSQISSNVLVFTEWLYENEKNPE